MGRLTVVVALVVAVIALFATKPTLAQGNYANYVKIIGVNYTNPAVVDQPVNITVLVEYAPPCLVTSPNSCMSTIMVALSNGTLTLASLPINTAPGILRFTFILTLTHVGLNTLYIDLYYYLNGSWVLVDRRVINVTVEPPATSSYTYIQTTNTFTITRIINATTVITITRTKTVTYALTITSTVNNTTYSTITIYRTTTTTLITNAGAGAQVLLAESSLALSVLAVVVSVATLLVLVRHLAARGR